MHRLSRTIVLVGLAPWLLATLLYVALLAMTDGTEGLRIALRDGVSLPLLIVPVAAVVIFQAVDRLWGRRVVEPALRAVVLGGATCAGMLASLLALGLLVSGADGAWTYVGWAVLSAYLPLLTVAAAVLGRRGVLAEPKGSKGGAAMGDASPTATRLGQNAPLP